MQGLVISPDFVFLVVEMLIVMSIPNYYQQKIMTNLYCFIVD